MRQPVGSGFGPGGMGCESNVAPMARLVALALPGGPAFVDAVRLIWDAGDAVAPLDPRSPEPLRRAQLATLAPDALVDGDGRHPLQDGRPVDDGDAAVLLTSGTSGTQRAAVLTHAALEASAYMSATAVGVDPSARWLACLPLHHVGGFGVVARALVTGAELEVHDGFDADAVTGAARAGCTHTSLVPTALGRIHPELFKVILLGGSHLPADRPPNTIGTYGMTETCGGVFYDGLALNGVAVRIENDEILLRSPTLLRCYRDGTDPVGPSGWFHTGDLGSLDPATGHLSVAGRAGDVIVTGGEKVWPVDVEQALMGDTRVAEVAVVGRPDDEWGQRVVALVVPVDPSDPPVLDDLVARVREALPRHAAPKALELVAALPRTSLGKIRRSYL
jgi:O-succinylbenzoic acid--CoA ligase